MRSPACWIVLLCLVARTIGAENTLQPLQFPADHGPHPDHRVESWSFMGHLASANREHYAFQLNLLRVTLTAAPSDAPPARRSRWAATQLWRAQFILTVPDEMRSYVREQLSRAGPALGLSGAQREPLRLWVHHWWVRLAQHAPMEIFQLSADVNDQLLTLRLSADKTAFTPIRSTSQADDDTTDAGLAWPELRFYALPRLRVQGHLQRGAQREPVQGEAWFDHLWWAASQPELERLLDQRQQPGLPLGGQTHWNRFVLQLEDGRELLLWQLHSTPRPTPPTTLGWLIRPDGTSYPLNRRDVRIEPLDHWMPSDRAARYPARWHIQLPYDTLTLEVVPLLADQELRTTARYWSGAVDVSGVSDAQPITGNGFVTLTGYVQPAISD